MQQEMNVSHPSSGNGTLGPSTNSGHALLDFGFSFSTDHPVLFGFQLFCLAFLFVFACCVVRSIVKA